MDFQDEQSLLLYLNVLLKICNNGVYLNIKFLKLQKTLGKFKPFTPRIKPQYTYGVLIIIIENLYRYLKHWCFQYYCIAIQAI